MTAFPHFEPETQIAFAARLEQIEEEQLGATLAHTVGRLSIRALDAELGSLVPEDRLRRLATSGLRGETFFPCPLVLSESPKLLAYYRLLYGISQKEFYKGAFAKFKSLEVSGKLGTPQSAELRVLCESLCETGWILLANLTAVSISRIRDLQLLTLGQQLKGGRLNEIGRAATRVVFKRIREAVADAAVLSESKDSIVLTNSSGRQVTVSFSSDPDIAITESLSSSTSNKLAIEIKGGTDFSNIHNRLGEAEKSHQKARAKGFLECWTIINVVVDRRQAEAESPSTNRFFDMSRIIDPDDPEWVRFRDELTSRLGVPAAT